MICDERYQKIETKIIQACPKKPLPINLHVR